jgi:hypothetical protein
MNPVGVAIARLLGFDRPAWMMHAGRRVEEEICLCEKRSSVV